MERLYHLALNLLPSVGAVAARRLLDEFQTAENIFRASLADLQQVPGIGSRQAARIFTGIADPGIMRQAEAEFAFTQKFKIKILAYRQPGYPARLIQTADAPALLFVKGNADLDAPKMISIVGTRHATAYGKAICAEVTQALAAYQVSIVSGLAWGIDIQAHREALKNGIPTLAVLGHGLSHLYPPEHRSTAEQMLETGALITEFYSGTNPSPGNFPRRNRIIAGLCDATLVVEAAPGGGALITAGIASSYDRDVFAFPGRTNDPYSKGCIELIRDHQAQLITSAEDMARFMNWDLKISPKQGPGGLPALTDPLEVQLINFVGTRLVASLEELADEFPQFSARLPAILLQLELKNVLRQLPGKLFERI